MKRILIFILPLLALQGCQFTPLINYVDLNVNKSLFVPIIEYVPESSYIDIAGTHFHFVKVDGGSFQMGSDSSQANEAPVHKVTVSTFYISETEVTRKLWRAIMYNEMPSKNTDVAINYVSWNDCQRFIRKLNAETGYKFALPTEAQWEFAARGGNRSGHYIYSGSDSLSEVAWYDCQSTSPACPAFKKPNELGLYDMTGNVDEWCQDWYGDYTSDAQTDPTGPSSGKERVARGGNYTSKYYDCHTTCRTSFTPSTKKETLGLRLVLVIAK